MTAARTPAPLPRPAPSPANTPAAAAPAGGGAGAARAGAARAIDANANASAMVDVEPPPSSGPAAAAAVARAASAQPDSTDVKSAGPRPAWGAGGTVGAAAAASVAGAAAKPAGTSFYYRASAGHPLVLCAAGPMGHLDHAGISFGGLEVYEPAAWLTSDSDDQQVDPSFEPGEDDLTDGEREDEYNDAGALPALSDSDGDDTPMSAAAAAATPRVASAAAAAAPAPSPAPAPAPAPQPVSSAAGSGGAATAAPMSGGSDADAGAAVVLSEVAVMADARLAMAAPAAVMAAVASTRHVAFDQRFDRTPRQHGPITITLERFMAKSDRVPRERPTLARGIVEPISTKDRAQAPEPAAGFRVSTAKAGAKKRKARNQGRVDMQKGHIWALENGGPDVAQNITPQWAQWQSNGAWRRMEKDLNALAQKVGKRGNLLYAEITVEYRAAANADNATFNSLTVPCRFRVSAWEVARGDARRTAVKGGETFQRDLDARQNATDDNMLYRQDHATMGSDSTYDPKELGLDKKKKRQKIERPAAGAAATDSAAAPDTAAAPAAAAAAVAAASSGGGGGGAQFSPAGPPKGPDDPTMRD